MLSSSDIANQVSDLASSLSEFMVQHKRDKEEQDRREQARKAKDGEVLHAINDLRKENGTGASSSVTTPVSTTTVRKLYDARTWMLRLPVSSNGVISTSDMDIGARGAPPQ